MKPSFLIQFCVFCSFTTLTVFNVTSQIINPAAIDTTFTPPLNRGLLNHELFNTIVVDSWLKNNQSKNKSYLEVFTIRHFTTGKQRNTFMGELVDSTLYKYQISALGYSLTPPSNSYKHVAYGSLCTLRINNNYFELNLIQPVSDCPIYIYGYLDNKNFLYIHLSSIRYNLDKLDFKDFQWDKFDS